MKSRSKVGSSPHGAILCALFSLVCSTSLPAATDGPQTQLTSIDFRAVGYDPRWQLEVDRGGEVRFHIDGAKPIVHATAATLDLHAGSTGVIFGAQTGTHELLAEIVSATCRDAISSEALTHTVRVRLNGVEYSGCGRGFDPRK